MRVVNVSRAQGCGMIGCAIGFCGPAIPMLISRFPVHVLMRRRTLANRWTSEAWAPHAVEIAGSPGDDVEVVAVAPVLVADSPAGAFWRFAGFALELHPSEAEGYYLNVREPEPKVFIMWRRDDALAPPVYPVKVTVSYNEAARMLDGGELVDAVPMPPEILAWVAPFVESNYRPEPRRKVRRNDPFKDGAFAREPKPGGERGR